MQAQRLPGKATVCAVGLALSMWYGAGLVSAQSAVETGPGDAQPAPPGFIVTPPLPIPRPSQPDARYQSPEATSPDGRSIPGSEPRGGGCRYQEQKLELLV